MNITTGNEVPEAVALRFKDIYESAEWKKLDPVDRAQLLLVAEGVKPGTIIGGDFTYMPNILEKLGLVSSLNTDPLELGPVYMVGTEKSLTTFHRGTIIDTPETNKPGYYHYLNGEFLGYPTCCTDEYCCPSKNLAARKKQSPHKFLSNVDFEVSELIEKTGTYPEELDFCPPSFTPCGANCDCASPILKKWMQILRSADPEAARELQEFNWRSNDPVQKVFHENMQKLRSGVSRILNS